jgi:hypothetical protein
MNLIERAKKIILTPKTEWEVIASEESSMMQVITSYVVPLAAVPAVAAFIGYSFIGVSVPYFGKVAGGINYGIGMAVTQFISAILGVVLTSYIVDMLATSFASQKNINKAAQLVAYSFTPAWIGGVLMMYPPLGMLGSLFGLYGLYLLYLGLPKLMKTPEDKVVIYLIVTIVVAVVVTVILSAIFTAIFGVVGLGMATVGM